MGSGQLILTDNGCLRLKAGEYTSLLIWPPNYSLNTEGNHVRVINENGQVAAEVGDEIQVGGGALVSPGRGHTGELATAVARALPTAIPRCRRRGNRSAEIASS